MKRTLGQCTTVYAHGGMLTMGQVWKTVNGLIRCWFASVKENTFAVGFRFGVGDAERLPADNFLERMLRTDFRVTPPECVFAWASETGEDPENNFGVGGRKADLRADFVGSFDLGVKGSTDAIEPEDTGSGVGGG